MKKAQVELHAFYVAKVSSALTVVRIVSESRYGGWIAINCKTGRSVRIKTAAKLRRRVPNSTAEITDFELFRI